MSGSFPAHCSLSQAEGGKSALAEEFAFRKRSGRPLGSV